jgi:hypothetical protein
VLTITRRDPRLADRPTVSLAALAAMDPLARQNEPLFLTSALPALLTLD